MHTIDLNCDMGEGAGNDAAIMPYISSANIACGRHAGDEDVMKQTVELAMKHTVAIGAHPGFADKSNFGRTEVFLEEEELYALITEQVYGMQKIAAAFGAELHHVKPHGALYNMAAKDKAMADIIARAVKDVYERLILYGLCNSHLIFSAQEFGLTTANEVFADRAYNADGSLVSRGKPGAVIEDDHMVAKQVLNMVLQNTVTATNGQNIYINAQTICLHGDGKHAVAFCRMINRLLTENNITIQTR